MIFLLKDHIASHLLSVEFAKIKCCFHYNGLSLNLDKIQLINFYSSRSNTTCLNFEYSLNLPEVSQAAVYLGLTVDQTLTWKSMFHGYQPN